MSNLSFPVNSKSLIIPYTYLSSCNSRVNFAWVIRKKNPARGKNFHPCKIKHEELHLRIFYDQGMANYFQKLISIDGV